MDSFCAIRTDYKDVVLWNESMEGNPKLIRISQRLAGALGNKVSIEAAILCAQRGGNPETLIEPATPPAPEPPAPPAPPAGVNLDAPTEEAGEAPKEETAQPPDEATATDAPPENDGAEEEVHHSIFNSFTLPDNGKDIMKANLESLTFQELRCRAKVSGASYSGRSNKEDLIAAIRVAEAKGK
jgi:hypothetical protein